jgi:hypothetical protein
MSRRKTTEEEFKVHIDKDPKNPDNYRPAEWTQDKKHSYWLNYYLARKQEIEAEEEFIKTGNAEFLRKARLYNHYKYKLVFEGRNLEPQQAPYVEIEKEPTTLTIWPPRPVTEIEIEACEKEERELERIFGTKYSVVRIDPRTDRRKRKTPEEPETTTVTNKRRKRIPPKKTTKASTSPSVINLIDGRPVKRGAEPPKTNLSNHQKNQNAQKTPSPITTYLNWRDIPSIALYNNSNNNSTETITEITSHQPVREPSYLTSPNIENNF